MLNKIRESLDMQNPPNLFWAKPTLKPQIINLNSLNHHLIPFQANSAPVELNTCLSNGLATGADLPRAPFDWAHANLDPIRQYLLEAQRLGKFVPQPGVPL